MRLHHALLATLLLVMTASCDPEEDPPPSGPPTYFVGTNEVSQIDPQYFHAAKDGDALTAIIGGQGAWMVVVAAATNQFGSAVDRVNVMAQLSSLDGSVVYGQLQYRKRPVQVADDGTKYIMNVFLVLPSDDTTWDGQPAVLSVQLEPYGGGLMLSDEVNVTLKKS